MQFFNTQHKKYLKKKHGTKNINKQKFFFISQLKIATFAPKLGNTETLNQPRVISDYDILPNILQVKFAKLFEALKGHCIFKQRIVEREYVVQSKAAFLQSVKLMT